MGPPRVSHWRCFFFFLQTIFTIGVFFFESTFGFLLLSTVYHPPFSSPALPDPALVGTTIAFFGDAGMGPVRRWLVVVAGWGGEGSCGYRRLEFRAIDCDGFAQSPPCLSPSLNSGNKNAVAVLNLALDEGADAIVHLGDLGCVPGPFLRCWRRVVNC